MDPAGLQVPYNELLTIYTDFSLREFRYKEGKTEEIRNEAKRLCEIYKEQCAQYIKQHPQVHEFLFGNGKASLGLDEATFFSWQHFSASLGSALARMQEAIE